MGSKPIVFDLQAPFLQPKTKYQTVSIDSVSAMEALSSCAVTRDIKLASCLHAKVLKSNLNDNIFINNALIDMYSKMGSSENAKKVFDQMPERSVVTWTSMVSGYSRNGFNRDSMLIFMEMFENQINPNEFTLAAVLHVCSQGNDFEFARVVHGYVMKLGFIWDEFLQISLVDLYSKCGKVDDALKILHGFNLKNVVAWSSVVSGCVLNGMAMEAIRIFFNMKYKGIEPNEVTLLSILHACSILGQDIVFHWVHGLVLKLGFYDSDLVMNSLIEMFLENGCYNEAVYVFCEFGFDGNGKYLASKTMASLLQVCSNSIFGKLGISLHGYLIKHGFFPCVVIENSLIDMYGENREIDYSRKIFSRMKNKDVISLNTMASCFVKNGKFYEALKLLKESCRCEIRDLDLDLDLDLDSDSDSPDFVMMLMAIQACSNLASLQLGESIHGYITNLGMINDMYIQNALIDMYGKSGRFDLAKKVFDEITTKDIGSYNSMISAYGYNGKIYEALSLFMELKESVIFKPNAITFTNILSACSHGGMIKEGFEIFDLIKRVYKLEPFMEHYACIVDLLGRLGKLEEAKVFIERMPVKPSTDIWGTLLGASWIYGNVKMAEKAAKEIEIVEPKSNSWRVGLSNAYASEGKWEEVVKVRGEMKGIEREGGWSKVELKGEYFGFMVNDTKNPKSEMIYMILNTFKKHSQEYF